MKAKLFYLLLFVLSISYAQIPTNGLTASYEFTNGALTDAANAVSFTQTGGSSIINTNDRFGVANKAIKMNADYLTRADINFPDGALGAAYDNNGTVSFWIKTTTNDANVRTIIEDATGRSSITDNTWSGYHIFLQDGYVGVTTRIRYNVLGYKAATRKATLFVSDGNWHHVVMTIGNTRTSSTSGQTTFYKTRTRIYIDGVDQGISAIDDSANISSSERILEPHDSFGDFKIANNSDNNLAAINRFFDEIDDLNIYTRQITQAEVTQLATVNNFCFPPLPARLAAINNPSETSLDILIFGASGGVSSTFDLAYVPKGQPFTSATIISGINNVGNTTQNLTGLQPSTIYNVYLRNNCTSTTKSAWSYPKEFRTHGVIYVNKNATGTNDGTSWANAYTNLQDALGILRDNGEIWVAKGTYLPHASDKTVSFSINRTNVKLYGGFNGTELTLNQRDFRANETILSGDLLGDDGGTIVAGSSAGTIRTDNSHIIVLILNNGAVIDGLTIANGHGQTTVSGGNYRAGAGINKTGAVNSLTIKNCTIKDNVSQWGAGLNATFTSAGSTLDVENCIFDRNIALHSSSFFAYANGPGTYTFKINNSLFKNNEARSLGGKLGFGGSGGWIRTDNAGAVITAELNNNTYTKNNDIGTHSTMTNLNRATVGATTINGTLNLAVANCIFWGNTITGGTIANSITGLFSTLGQNVMVVNSIDQGSFSKLTAANLTNTNNSDPLFTSTTDFTLQSGSPAINAGDNTKVPSAITTDLLGNQRIFNTTVDMGCYEYGSVSITNTVWTGATNTSWNNPGNWNNGVPTSATNVIIPNVFIFPIINNGVSASTHNLDIQTGSNLFIFRGSLSIDGDLTQNGTLAIQSDATYNGSLILKGTQSGSGSVKYNRHVTTAWHLLASPVVGQNIAAFKNDVAVNGVKYAIALYNNSLVSSRYTYYTTGAGINDINTAGNFVKGKGYSIRRSTAGAIEFLGNLNTSTVHMPILDGGATGNKWNLVGNPFTASINVNSNAHATDNFLTINASQLEPARVAIYVWNAATSSYDIINQATAGAKYVVPGQGFFVEAKNSVSTLEFKEVLQSHQVFNAFSRTSNVTPSIKISVTAGKNVKNTEIKYIDKTTIDLDPGYDAGVFSAESKEFNVFTRLVSNTNKTDFALQCLPNVNHEAMVIPLGVKSAAGKTITFSAESLGLPSEMKVYLEDKVNDSFTRIDKGTYEVILSSKETSLGRFYVHTAVKKPTHLVSTITNELNVFVSKNNTLQVLTKEQNQKTTVKVFNVLGQEVFTKIFLSKGTNELLLPKVTAGIYIVRLTTAKEGTLSKKVIIK